MAAKTFTVASASPRSFIVREFEVATLADAHKLIADEKADGWFAWIIEDCEVVEDWRSMMAARTDRRAERAFKALRAAEARA